jgi:glycosyltransferase involved in cell wall biosynthesis
VTRIGLDLLYLAPGRTGGMEVYARALVPRLVQAWPEASFTVFAGRELAAEWRETPWAPNTSLVALPVSSDTRIAREAVSQTLLAAAVARARVDLLHSLGSTTSLTAPAPIVVTIHDVIYKRHPDAHAGVLAHGMALLVPAGARRARRVIAVSHAAGRDLHDLLGIPDHRIDVVPSGPGIDAAVAPTPEPELRSRLELPDGPLVLSPSARRPHKNLPRLIAAMRGVDATLVLPGYATAFDDDLKAAAEGARVVFAGWVSDGDLEGLYAAATCLAFPSLAEGFGLPVLEAMRRGLPVACADATSLPELAGDAALLFDPLDVESIRSAITRLLGDGTLRADLARRGRERAQRFSWERAAEGTVASYRRALAGRDGG